jgi:ubiquinone/menaquinone biosynthesis C-methylase UbiE
MRHKEKYLSKHHKQLCVSPAESYWFYPTLHVMRRVQRSKCFKWALDVGCGDGASTLWIQAAVEVQRVIAVDIALLNSKTMRSNNSSPDKSFCLLQCSAEALPFKESSMDLVLCRSMLQYVNNKTAIAEMLRVCMSQAKVYVIANLSSNPIITLYRKFRTEKDLQPNMLPRQYLSYRNIQELQKNGTCTYHREYHLISPLLYPLVANKYLRIAGRVVLDLFTLVENALLWIFPFLRRWCWYSLIELQK